MSSRKIPLICSGHSRPVPELNYSKITQDGFFIVSACLDGKPQLRNGETGDWIGTFVGHKGAVWSAHLNSGALKAVTGSADYTAKIWNALTGDELQSFAHQRIVKTVRFSQDDKKIVTGGQDKILRIFDLVKTDSEPLQIEGHTDSIKVALWSEDDSIIFSASQDGIRIWDVRTLKEIKRLHSNPVSNLEFSLDKQHISASSGKNVLCWDTKSLEIVKQINCGVELNSCAVSPDSKNIIVGGADHSVRVFDFQLSKETELLKGHHGPVHCVRFAPDGSTFASGSEDGTIRLWLNGEIRSYGLWQEKDKEKDVSGTTPTKHE